MILYQTKPNLDGLCDFISSVVADQPRTTALVMLVMVDLIKHQGDSPANIIERATGERSNSTAEGCIARMKTMGLCDVVPSPYQGGVTGRRQVFLTSKAAKMLRLEAAPC